MLNYILTLQIRYVTFYQNISIRIKLFHHSIRFTKFKIYLKRVNLEKRPNESWNWKERAWIYSIATWYSLSFVEKILWRTWIIELDLNENSLRLIAIWYIEGIYINRSA